MVASGLIFPAMFACHEIFSGLTDSRDGSPKLIKLLASWPALAGDGISEGHPRKGVLNDMQRGANEFVRRATASA